MSDEQSVVTSDLLSALLEDSWALKEMRHMYQLELRQRAAQEQLADMICDAAQLELFGESATPELVSIENWTPDVMQHSQFDTTPNFSWVMKMRRTHTVSNYSDQWRWSLSY